VSQLWGGVSWGWLVEGAVVEGWGRGGGYYYLVPSSLGSRRGGLAEAMFGGWEG
jgi:hypothetical protein